MEDRRKFLKRALYVTPAILTVAVRPSFAAQAYGPGNGSGGGGSVTPEPRWRVAGRVRGDDPWWAFWRWFD
ncbi:MAG: hypothetical protein ACUVYA_00285 [Planctomycetota bacterium]